MSSPPPPLPEFPDETLAAVCRFLGVRELVRLACVSRRFTERTLTEPGGGGAILSPIEEGARLQLAGGGSTASRHGQTTWLRALWHVESRLVFTSCDRKVELREDGASL